MSVTSWFTKQASMHFRRTPEGLVFNIAAPWLFGQPREYRVSDAQREQLLPRLARATKTSSVLSVAAMVVAVIMAMNLMPGLFTGGSSIVAVFAGMFLGALLTFPVLLLSVRLAHQAASPVLAGVPWTRATREPFNLKKAAAAIWAGMMVAPTWILVVGFVSALVTLPMSFIAWEAGEIGVPELLLCTLLLPWMLLFFGAALVTKRGARRSAE